jgi:3-hydroxyisobutyrate dehydrogenase-like beta-hydroxyacid dehydrogenase
MMSADTGRVGFIGLGNMGEGMVFNLATKGFAPIVYDPRADVVARAVASGAEAASGNGDIGQRCQIVCIAVFNDQQVDAVVFGADDDEGVLAHMAAGGVLLLHPTSAPSTVFRVSEAAAAKGISVLDVPMTGGANVAARAGTLTFMVGGDTAVVARVRPVLEAMATSIFHVGPLGSGVAAKIINNFLGISQTLLVREALRLARSSGIEGNRILEIVNQGGVGSSWQSINWQRIVDQEAGYTTGKAGMVAMASKDMLLAEQLASEFSVPAPCLGALVGAGLPDIAASGLTDSGL